MKRVNATQPRWDGERWTHRPMIDGKQRKITSRKPGKAGSQECIRKENAIRAGLVASGTRLERAWSNFLTDQKERLGATSDGYKKAECHGRIHVLPRLKNKKVSEITSQDWQNVLNRAKSLKGEPLSRKTLMNVRGDIMAFCKFALKSDLIDKMPFDLTIPKKAEFKGKNILQPEDVKMFLDDESDEWWFYCWQLQLVTGLRPGEALGLQRRDVKDGLIVVRRAINSKNEITKGKNSNALRTIVQSDLAAEIIQKQLAKLSANKIDLPWLFPDKYGCQPNPYTVSEHFKRYAEKFSVHVTQYCLRHTFVSLMQNSLPPGMMKDYIGHSESMDTLGVYGHKLSDGDKQTATIISGVFGKLKTGPNLVPDENENTQDPRASGVSVGAANGT